MSDKDGSLGRFRRTSLLGRGSQPISALMSSHYRLNEPDVSSELFDGEVLAINLKTGHYFSVLETGILVWQLLVVQGGSVEDTAAALTRAFPDEADAASDARAFVFTLEAAGLIVPTAMDAGRALAPTSLGTPGGAYHKPVLEKYTDMKELLLIDPIHEVDVHAGWPTKPPSPEPA
jgi:hypothetical protein